MALTLSHLKSFCCIIMVIAAVDGVDRNNFKTCEQSGFCRRNRKLQPRESSYTVKKDTIVTTPSSFQAEILNTDNNVAFKLEFFSLSNNTGRLKINELNPLKPRYEVTQSLDGEPKLDTLTEDKMSENSSTFLFGTNKVVVTHKPFRMDFYSEGEIILSLNSRGLMNFEHIRNKPAPPEEKPEDPDADQEKVENETKEEEGTDNQPEDVDTTTTAPIEPSKPEEEEQDLWEETFKGFTDSKPNGPTSIGLDFSFLGFDNVYGIPEHADDFSLKTTSNTDPYRLYNLDVFAYELRNPMALYGSIPYMIAHRPDKSVGIFWNNAAEMWIDVNKNSNQNVVTSVMNYVKGETQIPQVDTHWMAETGIVDVFIFMGPKPKDVMFQYCTITGFNVLPHLFAIAYHQSRWNYRDQDDVKNVDAGFDEHEIPYDVLWLDIEHTDSKKYFTWDAQKFGDSVGMINALAAKGRKMVTINDPHIKRETGYFVFDEGTKHGYFVKNKDGGDLDGWCWPGSSSWVDFLNPEASEWWAGLYSLDKYQGSTLDLYAWNDMNEPSVFNGPEITMEKENKHHNNLEHREIHNVFGMLQQKATYDGHIKRSNGKLRPFILSRAFSAGTQRYGAIWTGDNTASWEHLKISVPMLLTISVAGVPFCGADIGGFFGDPDPELLVRWYQAAAFQPFFRAHAHIETKRREPWLFGDELTTQIRDAITLRYKYLPYWYTLFYQHMQSGVPPMRPLWMEFPADKNTFSLEDQYLVGDALLIYPVVESSVSNVNVYFPDNSIWYDIYSRQQFSGPASFSIPVTMKKIPVFQRGGTIIPKKERIRRASSLTINDPYTLIVALDKDGSAEGMLYIDDGSSFEYKEGKFLYMKFTFNDSKLSTRQLNNKPSPYATKSWLERVIIVGVKTKPSNITIDVHNEQGNRQLESSYQKDTRELIIRKPAVNMGLEWTISLH